MKGRASFTTRPNATLKTFSTPEGFLWKRMFGTYHWRGLANIGLQKTGRVNPPCKLQYIGYSKQLQTKQLRTHPIISPISYLQQRSYSKNTKKQDVPLKSKANKAAMEEERELEKMIKVENGIERVDVSLLRGGAPPPQMKKPQSPPPRAQQSQSQQRSSPQRQNSGRRDDEEDDEDEDDEDDDEYEDEDDGKHDGETDEQKKARLLEKKLEKRAKRKERMQKMKEIRREQIEKRKDALDKQAERKKKTEEKRKEEQHKRFEIVPDDDGAEETSELDLHANLIKKKSRRDLADAEIQQEEDNSNRGL